MLENFLSKEIYDALSNCGGINDINEIRIRIGKPIVVICNLKTYFLSQSGFCSNKNMAIYGSKQMIEDIIFKASDYSIYSVNEQIRRGYIMITGGVRIGICGEIAGDGAIKTIKNFTSLCIRIPHQIKNVSLPIFNQILDNGNIKNTLIISPPGAGKTTMLRDLVYQFSNHNYPFNIFIADERGEITGGNNSKIDLGCFCDSLSFYSKSTSIIMGIRSMSPNIVVTDELGEREDFIAVEQAVNCGVNVIATIHAGSLDEVRQKPEMKELVNSKAFKRYVVLSKENGVGTIEGVYRENFTRIYGGALWNLSCAWFLFFCLDLLAMVLLGFILHEKNSFFL